MRVTGSGKWCSWCINPQLPVCYLFDVCNSVWCNIYVFVSSKGIHLTRLYFGAQDQDQDETKQNKTRQNKAEVEVYVRKKKKHGVERRERVCV